MPTELSRKPNRCVMHAQLPWCMSHAALCLNINVVSKRHLAEFVYDMHDMRTGIRGSCKTVCKKFESMHKFAESRYMNFKWLNC